MALASLSCALFQYIHNAYKNVARGGGGRKRKKVVVVVASSGKVITPVGQTG